MALLLKQSKLNTKKNIDDNIVIMDCRKNDHIIILRNFAPYVGNQDLNSLYRFIKSNDHFITTMLIFSSTKIYIKINNRIAHYNLFFGDCSPVFSRSIMVQQHPRTQFILGKEERVVQ
ncbi:hypothetical protein V1477_009633 [Vespula maculifrons]|uniref:Uncharacterized protein n=1 Tax=Vespula maculifrons TaxID=7453 RepID=A0ABD2CB77_VESMC